MHLLASSAMFSLTNSWRDQRASLALKICLFKVLVMSVLHYAAETWMLLSQDPCRIEAFHAKCFHSIMRIQWYDFITDQVFQEVLTQATVPPLAELRC